MNTKRWAVFLVFLLTTHYIDAAAGNVKHRQKRQTSCSPTPQLQQMMGSCFDRVKEQLDGSFPLQDDVVDNMQLTNGQVSGLGNFKMSPVTCACFRDFVRFFVKLSFLDVTVTFVVTLLDGLLGGLLGNLGTSLARLVGNLVNQLVRLLALEINVVISIDQRFIPGSTCTVSSYRVTRISEIKVLGIDLTQLLVNLLGDILTPVVDTLLKNLLNNQVRAIITAEVQKLRITPEMYNCRR